MIFNGDTNAPAPSTSQQAVVEKENKSTKLKTFTGQEFSDLYNSYAYPNTQAISEDSPITGDEAADKVIKELAVARGYKLRSAPVTNNFVEISEDMLLQQRAAVDWLKMQEAATKEGHDIQVNAAYRSAEDQRTIFNTRIKSIPLANIAARKADAAVNNVLKTTAVPGYSRHHTGYTVDIVCYTDASKKFEDSKCNKWLSDNNYQNAKTYGWIPSYPDGAGMQGPDPEPWEYVWVGSDVLYE
ncbi:M15 family metallopeptidase [Candidatus Saccharibacteria bacterium]|nr:M15 family metallopeptidase [Candidatus Saccharibacteria bacterium]